MDKKKIGIILSIMVVLFIGVVFAVAQEDVTDTLEKCAGRMFHKKGPQLTEEQRAAVSQKMAELKEQGLSREEVRTEMQAMFQELGIEKPAMQGMQRPHMKRGFGKHEFNNYFSQLTEEQKEILSQKMKEHREEMKSTFEELGIECPRMK